MKGQGLTNVDLADAAKLIDDAEWVAEQKMDGTRCMVEVTDAGIEFYSGNGGRLTHSAAAVHFGKIERAFEMFHLVGGRGTFDGELVHYTGIFWIFDMPEMRGVITDGQDLEYRRGVLEVVDRVLAHDVVRLIPQARTTEEKRHLWDTVEREGGEGVVFKRRSVGYLAGVKHGGALKIKFRKSCEAVVHERNINGGCNARLRMLDPTVSEREAIHIDGLGRWRLVGGCSMIGKPDAQPGDVVEVGYLYATEASQLYQPSLWSVRYDKFHADCTVDQLRIVRRDLAVTL